MDILRLSLLFSIEMFIMANLSAMEALLPAIL